MNTNLTPCPPHTAGTNVWELHCTQCGTRLLEGGISIEELMNRVYAIVQAPVETTGRIRGTWVELLEEGDGQLWAYWARPARNFAGYEAIDTINPEPTGEQLSGLLLAELAGLQAEGGSTETTPLPEPAMPARAHKRPSRWTRFKRWTRVTAEREFLTIAAPLCIFWGVALFTVLGWDGVKALVNTVF